ncbi:putative glycosidase CRH2, partial [Massospora cicadina]
MGVLGHGAGVCTYAELRRVEPVLQHAAGWVGASYGFCGAGCHEEGNFNSTRCLPNLRASDGTFKVSTDRIAEEVGFNGDYINRDFTVQGEYSIEGEDFTEAIEAWHRHGTAFHTLHQLCGVGGEVDFEFVGNGEIQSNWYYQGIVPGTEFRYAHVPRKDDQFPSTTRFSFSIAGRPSGEAGTREWAGGMVNWDLIKPSGAFTLTDDDFELDSELDLSSG